MVHDFNINNFRVWNHLMTSVDLEMFFKWPWNDLVVQRTGQIELGDLMCGLKGQIMVILRSNEADCESVWSVRQTESIENLHELHGITWGHLGSTEMMVDDFKMSSSLLWNINFILDLFISPKPKVNCNFKIRQSKISVPKISNVFKNWTMSHKLWVVDNEWEVMNYFYVFLFDSRLAI